MYRDTLVVIWCDLIPRFSHDDGKINLVKPVAANGCWLKPEYSCAKDAIHGTNF